MAPTKTKAEHTITNFAPTTGNINAYLTDSWNSRSKFTPQQRAGFAQFVFLMLCAHLEEMLYTLLKTRYEAVSRLGESPAPIRTLKHGTQTIGTTATKIGDGNHSVVVSDGKSAGLSVLKLMERKQKTIQKEPIDSMRPVQHHWLSGW